MALSVSSILDAIAPQFSTDADKSTFITIATGLTSTSCFGDNMNLAIALRTAHMMTIRDMEKDGVSSAYGGASGAVTSKREGDLSISFGNNSSGNGSQNEDLNLTKYGKQLLGLMRGQIIGFSLTGAARPNCDGGVDLYDEDYLL